MKKTLSTLIIMMFAYNLSADINGVNPPKKRVDQNYEYNDSRNGGGTGGGSRG